MTDDDDRPTFYLRVSREQDPFVLFCFPSGEY